MGVFDDLVGQERAARTLRRARPPGREMLAGGAGPGMTHAWLFTGPPGSGREEAARAFAAALFCPDRGCGHCDMCHQVADRLPPRPGDRPPAGSLLRHQGDPRAHPPGGRARRRWGAGGSSCSRAPTGPPSAPPTRCSRPSRSRRRDGLAALHAVPRGPDHHHQVALPGGHPGHSRPPARSPTRWPPATTCRRTWRSSPPGPPRGTSAGPGGWRWTQATRHAARPCSSIPRSLTGVGECVIAAERLVETAEEEAAAATAR